MKKFIAMLGMSTVLLSSISAGNFVMAENMDSKNLQSNTEVSSEITAPAVEKTPDITVLLNGNIIDFKDQRPVIIQGRTLVPFRAILESMGAEVQWDGTNRTVRAFKDGIGMVLEIGNKVALVGTEKMELEVPAQIINDRTMVPLRFVSEGLGYKVDFDNSDLKNYKINITKTKEDEEKEKKAREEKREEKLNNLFNQFENKDN